MMENLAEIEFREVVEAKASVVAQRKVILHHREELVRIEAEGDEERHKDRVQKHLAYAESVLTRYMKVWEKELADALEVIDSTGLSVPDEYQHALTVDEGDGPADDEEMVANPLDPSDQSVPESAVDTNEGSGYSANDFLPAPPTSLRTDRSLLLCLPGNPVRDFAVHVTSHPIFDKIIMTVIICNCVTMALDSPYIYEDNIVDPRNNMALVYILNILDVIFTITFTVEGAPSPDAWCSRTTCDAIS
jgi:hypothetical protein